MKSRKWGASEVVALPWWEASCLNARMQVTVLGAQGVGAGL